MKSNIVVFFVLLVINFSCGQKKVENVEILRPVRYGLVQSSGNEQKHTFSGTVQSSKETDLSFKVSGALNRLLVKVGDEAKTGQLIARLDAADYQVQSDQAVAQLRSAETQIKSSEAQLYNAKSTLQRVEKLYENNSVPISDYEQTKASYEAAQSQYEAAVAQVTAAQTQVTAATNQVRYAGLTAPFDGIITALQAEENEFVASGKPIATLSAEVNPEINVGIPEVYISRIRRGQVVDISFSVMSGQRFAGTITEVGYSSASGTTYPVIIQIKNPSEEIRPGMAASATFNFGSTDLEKMSNELVLPVKSVGEDANGNFVFLLQEDQDAYKVAKKYVEIEGLLAGGFGVKKGVLDGDLVATAGLKELLDGMRVKLLEESN